MKKFNNIKRYTVAAVTAAILSACGGGVCAPNSNGGNLTLAIEAPSQYPAGVAVTAYLTMTNTSNVDGTNLVYTTMDNHTGVVITIDPNGAGQNCANIPAGKSCTFTASIPAGSKPGSFTVLATPNGNIGQSTKTAQSSKSLQANSISVTANLGLVDVPNTQNQYYILPSNQSIIANPNGNTNVMVSVWIKQAGEGLNSIQLVDELGEALNATLVNTQPSYAVNSILTYSVSIPKGKSIQHIQALSEVCKTLNNGNNNNSACSNDADVNLASQGNGILSIQPTYVNMSESYSTQVITLTNTGNGTVSNMVYPNWAILGQGQFATSENNCINFAKLDAGQSCTITLNYTVNSNSGQITPVFSYDDDNNNGTAPKNTEIVVPYTGTSPATPFSVLTVQPNSVSLTPNNPKQVITITCKN